MSTDDPKHLNKPGIERIVRGDITEDQPCWILFIDTEGGHLVTHTIHHVHEEVAKAFAGVVAQECGWPAIYLQRIAFCAQHDVDKDGKTLKLQRAAVQEIAQRIILPPGVER